MHDHHSTLLIRSPVPSGLLAAVLLASAGAQTPPAAPSGSPLPFVFEANGGRYDAAARFVAHAPAYDVYLTERGVVLDLPAAAPEPGGPAGVALRMDFVAAHPHPLIEGGHELAGRIHYLVGSASRWSVDNPTFAEVRYRELWPGVGVRCYGTRQGLEYDFEVAPGGDPSMIRLRFAGHDAIARGPAGELVLRTAVGRVVQDPPIVYQERDGRRERVAGRFVILAADTVGFAVPDYDRTRPLVVDPVLRYATYIGGSSATWARAIGVDGAGRAIVAGRTQSADLPVTPGAYQSARGAGVDAFVAKLTPNGDGLVFCTYLGGAVSAWTTDGYDDVFDLEVGAAGEIYLGGVTECTDFPVTGWVRTGGRTFSWGFVAALAADGSAVTWAAKFAGDGHNRVRGIDLDSAGRVVAVGSCERGFPTTANAYQTAGNPFGTDDAFVLKLTPTGTGPVWSTLFGSAAAVSVRACDVALDAADRVFVVGVTGGTVPVTTGAFQPAFGGGGSSNGDGFLFRLSADATTLDYSTHLGGASPECAERWPGVACDDAGRAWFVGESWSADWPVSQGAYQAALTGSSDAVVACLDTNAQGAASLVFSTFLGGSDRDAARGVVVDGAGSAWVSGVSRSGDFPAVNAVQPCNRSSPRADAFVVRLDAGGQPAWSTLYGGTSEEDPAESASTGRICRGANGALYVSGATGSTDLATPGAQQTVRPGLLAGFVFCLDPAPSTLASATVRTACVAPAPPSSLLPRGTPVLGRRVDILADDPTDAVGMPRGGAVAWWLVSLFPPAGLPCGVVVPGLGGNGAAGEILIGLQNPMVWVPGGQVWQGPGTPAVFLLPVPCNAALGGARLWTQGVFTFGNQVVLTDAVDLVLGS